MISMMSTQGSSPRLAIIVVVFNMQREAPRTLYSLSLNYQQDVSSKDYDVIVVENGSSEPLEPEEVAEFGANFHYLRIENASPSPASAINLVVARSSAPFVGIMIDGARLVSPGVVSLALEALTRFERVVVGTIGFHLGPDIQTRSSAYGYNRKVEDDLLTEIDWRNNGYRLFEISALAGASRYGWFGNILESNLLFMPRTLFGELEGFDERFNFPGGGLANADFYRRASELKDTTLITLFGEATFHQIHGGAIADTPEPEAAKKLKIYGDQYQEIRGIPPFEYPRRHPLLIGFHRREALQSLREMYSRVLQLHADSSMYRRYRYHYKFIARFLALMKSLLTNGRNR